MNVYINRLAPGLLGARRLDCGEQGFCNSEETEWEAKWNDRRPIVTDLHGVYSEQEGWNLVSKDSVNGKQMGTLEMEWE